EHPARLVARPCFARGDVELQQAQRTRRAHTAGAARRDVREDLRRPGKLWIIRRRRLRIDDLHRDRADGEGNTAQVWIALALRNPMPNARERATAHVVVERDRPVLATVRLRA